MSEKDNCANDTAEKTKAKAAEKAEAARTDDLSECEPGPSDISVSSAVPEKGYVSEAEAPVPEEEKASDKPVPESPEEEISDELVSDSPDTEESPADRTGETSGETEDASTEKPAEEPEISSPQTLSIEVDMLSVINFALQQNGEKVVRKIIIKNTSDKRIEDLELRISSGSEICIPFSQHIDFIPGNSEYEMKDIGLILSSEKIAVLTERMTDQLFFDLYSAGERIFRTTKELTALAYDQWQGLLYDPALLCSFITPNHPDVIRIISKASGILERWGEDPSFEGYQSQDPNRILRQAAAIYEALREEKISYSVTPASFEEVGQRIRLCDAVMENRMGNCMDLTLFYASALEAVGIHPLLIIEEGHIFTGFWLEDKSFPETIQDDPSILTKNTAEGVNEIAVAESTMFTSGSNSDFDASMEKAKSEIPSAIIFIDVTRARKSGIRPIPMRIKTENGYEIRNDDITEKELLSSAPKKLIQIDSDNISEGSSLTKRQQWERKLLDLGLRNSLINFRLSKTTVPILTPSIDSLEDALADGEDFSILPKPDDIRVGDGLLFENLHKLGECEELILSEFKNHRLRSVYTAAELEKNIKELYRSAKTSIEENGANTLYISLGLLRWYETEKSTRPRYAPILLLPIDIVRKSAAKGYTIRLRDDDIQFNITILEKLKQDFEIVIDGLDPLPTDEHGVDTRKVYSIIRKAVMSRKNWDVLESAYIGIFSFSQFVMWNDIRNRSEDLEKNKIVKSLIDGKLDWDAKEMEIGDEVSENDVFLPVPADASQLYAIKAATQGESFVLHGPPGTGKSQTITAIIANSLANGKKVLFVAEKMAALEVVQKRLEKIGIGDFCLELHSNKTKKRDLLEQLRKASEVTKYHSTDEYASKAEEISKLRSDLNFYSKSLHKKRECGRSLFEIIGEYEVNSGYPDIPMFPSQIINSIDQQSYENMYNIVRRLVSAGRAVGHPMAHPLSPVRAEEYSQRIRLSLDEKIANYRSSLDDAAKSLSEYTALTGMTVSSHSQIEMVGKAVREAVLWSSIPEMWRKTDNINTLVFGIWDMCEHFKTYWSMYASLSQRWKPDFFTLDGKALMNEYRDVSSKWAISKALGIGKLTKQLGQYTDTPVGKEELETIIRSLCDYQTEKQEAERLFEYYGGGLEDLYQASQTDWNRISALASQAKESAVKLAEITGSDDFRINCCGKPGMKELAEELPERIAAMEAARQELYSALEIVSPSDIDWIESEKELCDEISSHSGELREWIAWNGVASEARNAGLDIVLQAYLSGMEHGQIEGAFKKSLSKSLAVNIIDSSRVLNKFTGNTFNDKIDQFRKLDKDMIRLSKNEIYCRLASKVPNFTREAAQNSELGILQRAIRSTGRGLSIRKLLDQLPNLLPRLCPCMLMSPISAAQYLDPAREPFDIVVFDEASQMPTCKAVGALARAENAVIVGDPKQMPPTSFFVNNTSDEENIDIEDMESILDDCLALNMPQTHLLWHYRSRHESLIAFSNREFYENKLYTFPSVNDRERKVTFVKTDGIFDRGKTRQNKVEAEAVVNEIIGRYRNEAERAHSIGVVTFNISQKNLIEDMLNDACAEDPGLENWIYNSPEPLFVKNLENVQGDERDVILFSVGFGPDSSGRVSMNFGPLNREGGWRRLNVAVSRARCEMKVFSSMTADMINLSSTSAEGVAALKEFIAYAAGKELPADENSVGSSDESISGISASICSALKEKGYETDLLVGHSEYKIDIGVIDPDSPEKYILGILLDGASYGQSKTARDREIGQVSVLRGLGWRILRVWSMDWWDNRKKEIDRILKELESIRRGEHSDDRGDEKDEEPDIQAGSEMTRESEIRVYTSAKLPYNATTPDELVTSKYYDIIVRKMKKVIDQEAPVCQSYLVRKIIKSFGIARTSSKLQDHMNDILSKLYFTKTRQGEEVIIWNENVKPSSYSDFRSDGQDDDHRDITEVPLAEGVNAVLYVLYNEVSLKKPDLVKESAKIMNYRSGSNITAFFEKAVDTALSEGLAQADGEDNCTLTEKGMKVKEK